MKLDPGIHIVMHSILSLKPGVTNVFWNFGIVALSFVVGNYYPIMG